MWDIDGLRVVIYQHGYLGNICPAAFEKQTSGLYEMVH